MSILEEISISVHSKMETDHRNADDPPQEATVAPDLADSRSHVATTRNLVEPAPTAETDVRNATPALVLVEARNTEVSESRDVLKTQVAGSRRSTVAKESEAVSVQSRSKVNLTRPALLWSEQVIHR